MQQAYFRTVFRTFFKIISGKLTWLNKLAFRITTDKNYEESNSE